VVVEMALSGFVSMVVRVKVMTSRQVCVMSSFFVRSSFMMFRCFLVMVGSVFEVLRSLLVVFSGFL
jgi:hypothetical protein